VIAAELTVETSDFSQLEPMVTKARAELAAVGIDDMPEVVVADAGYWQKQGIQSSSARACRRSSLPTPTNARAHDPAAAAGSTTSCAAS
jgi:hypothetical protein